MHTLQIGIFWGKIYKEIIEICVRMNNSYQKCFYVAMQSPSWRVHTESPRGIFYSRNFINLILDVVAALKTPFFIIQRFRMNHPVKNF